MQQSLEGIRGRGQKSTACSEDISVREFYLSAPTLHFLQSIIFIFCLLAPEGMNAIVFGRDKGRGQKSTACSETPRYSCYEMCIMQRMTHIDKTIYYDNIMINVSCTAIACSIILSSVKLEKSQHSGESIGISHDLLTSSP